MRTEENKPSFLNTGYNNCDIEKNGEIDVICSFIKENDIVFDVGANIGEWSVRVLQKKSNISLHLFEPLPLCFTQLSAIKRLQKAKLNNFAVSSFDGQSIINFYSSIPVLSSIYRRNQQIEQEYNLQPTQIQIQTKTIDTYCKEQKINNIDFLKIDTEGAETDVINGAMEMIKGRKIKHIQFEYGGCFLDASRTFQGIYKILSYNKYEIYRIHKNLLIHIPKFEPSLENYKYSNYLAIQRR